MYCVYSTIVCDEHHVQDAFKNIGVFAWLPLFPSCRDIFNGSVNVMYDNHLKQIPCKWNTVTWQGSSEQAIKQLTGPQWIIWDNEGFKGYTSCCSKFEQKKAEFFLFMCGDRLWNSTGLIARYDIFGLEMLMAEDPAPQLVLSFGDCFIVSTTTIGSLQETKTQ